MENQIYELNGDMIDKFMEQKEWNREAVEARTEQTRKMQKIKADLMAALDRQTAEQARIQAELTATRSEFSKVLGIVNSLLEAQYLAQLLEFQDEVDRHSMSLWAMAPQENPDGSIQQQLAALGDHSCNKPSAGPSPRVPLKLDEDCLSCSLEKYRPLIKQAFKMACV